MCKLSMFSVFYLFIKVHEKYNLVLYWREKVVFVDQLVDIFVSQSQVDF